MFKKWIFLLFVMVSLFGCTSNGLSGEKPPNANVVVGDKYYKTVLGSYCWSRGCADTTGPIDLVEDSKPINVSGGEVVTIKINYKPQPTEYHLEQHNGDMIVEVPFENLQFSAPEEPGIYVYSLGAWWLNENYKNVSSGDAFYAFSIEVLN